MRVAEEVVALKLEKDRGFCFKGPEAGLVTRTMVKRRRWGELLSLDRLDG